VSRPGCVPRGRCAARSPPTWAPRSALPAASGVAAAVIATAALGRSLSLYPLVFWSLGAFVAGTIAQEYWRAVRARMRSAGESPLVALATLLRKNQRRYGGYLVHLRVGVILIRIAAAPFTGWRP